MSHALYEDLVHDNFSSENIYSLPSHLQNVSSFPPEWYEGDSQIVADIVAADVISARMAPAQSFGDTLSQILPKVVGVSPFEGFSLHDIESCRGTVRQTLVGGCTRYHQRDDACRGERGTVCNVFQVV